MYRKKSTPWLFMAPALIVLGVFMFYPTVRSLYLSFTSYNFLSDPTFKGLANYKKLFSDPKFIKSLKQTLQISIFVITANVIIPLLLAVLINQKLKFINFFRTSYYIPVITSMVVVGIIWQGLYAEYGVLNYILLKLGIIKESFNWLTERSTSLFAVAIVIIWRGLGYYMVIYLAGLQGIPQVLYEASEIDGANKVKQFFHVTIPLLVPSIVLVLVMTTINSLKIFDEVYVMTGGGPLGSTETLVYFIYDQAFDKLNAGYASAAGTILFMISMFFSVINIYLSRKYED